MLVNTGWCVYIVVEGRRKFVQAMTKAGEPVFTFYEKEALFCEEFEARQLQQLAARLFENVRVLYVPAAVRRVWGNPWNVVT